MQELKNKLAQGVETLIYRLQKKDQPAVFDVVIIGSGYGGAVAAARLAAARNQQGTPLSVCVLERGREFQPGDFPKDFARLPAEVRFEPAKAGKLLGFANGLFDFHFNDDVSILRGNGLGGGSLINASVVERMSEQMWQAPQWPQNLRVNWRQFEQYYQRVENMLGAQVLPRAQWPQKTFALEKLGAAVDAQRPCKSTSGNTPPHSFRPVKLALNQADKTNDYGIEQKACVACGDCFTGCNFNAKNSLNLNYLPLAKRHGAEIFTGATVRYVEQIQLSAKEGTDHASASEASLWKVHFGLTDATGSNIRDHHFSVCARQVVLAAGTLGSTEILLRSREKGLKLSAQLGSRFSGNGDMIWAGYNQKDEVNPGTDAHQPYAQRKVGPTITAMLDLRQRSEHPHVVQDAAVPAGLYRVFSELVTTSNLLYRMAQRCPDETGAKLQIDPDAVNPMHLQHTAVYLSMGIDEAAGQVEYVPVDEHGIGDKIRVRWPNAGQGGLYRATEQYLRAGVAAIGGELIASPSWRAYPEKLDSALSGKKPTSHLITVHPLGGCVMADSHQLGVVNDVGAVYDCQQSNSVYRGLYVWDGSIVPLAVGINPLLTIAALAERAVEHCIASNGWHVPNEVNIPTETAKNATSLSLQVPETPAEPDQTIVKFREVMAGKLQLPRTARGHSANSDLTMDAALSVHFTFKEDLPSFLRNPKRIVRITDANLKLGDNQVIEMEGQVEWLTIVPKRRWVKIARALKTYGLTRAIPDLLGRSKGESGTGKKSIWAQLQAFLGLVNDGGALINLASHIGGLRQLRYTLRPKEGQSAIFGKQPWVLHGVKKVEYQVGNNLWRSLSNLDVNIRPARGPVIASGVLELDWYKLLHEKSMQIVESSDNTHAILDLMSMAGFFARALFRLHFWNFRKPDYPEGQRRFPRPGPLHGLKAPQWHAVALPPTPSSVTPLAIELTHYSAEGEHAQQARPVLLIHGFGASGLQFTTDAMPQNLTQHLCGKGYDVWVLELRTSVALHSSAQQWKLDEVAQTDIPCAVKHVLQHYEGKFNALDVVAHCIGSAMFNIAVLSGRLQGDDGQSLIRSAVMLQVGPIFKVSKTNRVRGEGARLMRDMMNMDFIDSSMDDASAEWQDILLDRLLASHPLPPAEAEKLRSPFAIRTDIANYLRSTGVFGRLFEIDNLSEEMRNKLGDLLGQTNLTTYQQILHALIAEKLVDQFGRNVYVRDENFAQFYRFNALFIHGKLNDVFDPACTKESVEKLQQIFSKDAFLRIEFENYGHLDPLVGRNAAQDIFPEISDFLARPLQPLSPSAQEPETVWLAPHLGPIVGWVRPADDGIHTLCRIWLKAKELTQALQAVEYIVLDAGGKLLPGSYRQHAVLQWPRFTVCVVDVALLPGQSVVMCSRHSNAISLAQASAMTTADFVPAMPTPQEIANALSQLTDLAPTTNWPRFEADMWQRWQEDPRAFGHAQPMLASSLEKSQSQEPAKSGTDSFCFALGSCRYSGSPLEQEMGDGAWHRLWQYMMQEPAQQPALCLLMGDQIYVDATAGVLERKARTEVILERYEEAYSSNFAASLFARLPTYQALDDHEIGNDWEPPLNVVPHHTALWDNAAQAAFLAYQWAHSPRNAQMPNTAAQNEPGAPCQGLWYDFVAEQFPFFVMDTRLERGSRHVSLRTAGAASYLHSAAQMEAISTWARQAQATFGDRPKFIVSPSALAPLAPEVLDELHSRNDGWFAYPESLRWLTDLLIDGGITNLVMLSGDLHASFASHVTLDNGKGQTARLLALVFSPIYAPYSFINGSADAVLEKCAAPLHCAESGYQLRYERVWSESKQGLALLHLERNSMSNGWEIEFQMLAKGAKSLRLSL